jgi:hypothetical protein
MLLQPLLRPLLAAAAAAAARAKEHFLLERQSQFSPRGKLPLSTYPTDPFVLSLSFPPFLLYTYSTTLLSTATAADLSISLFLENSCSNFHLS